MKKFFTSIILVLVLYTVLWSQTPDDQPSSGKYYLSPVITLGYTFGSGWTYGVDLTVGIMQIQENLPPVFLAGSVQYYFINYRTEVHRVMTFNAFTENGFYRMGAGIGLVSKKWGYKNVNSDRALGLSAEVDLSYNDPKIPWAGLRVFLPVTSWPWIKQPYYVSGIVYWRSTPWYLF